MDFRNTCLFTQGSARSNVIHPYRIRGIFASALFFICVIALPAQAASTIVISQVYGGGGNSGATLKNDFVELFNRSNAPVSVEGWTIQHASSTGSTWDRIQLTGTIAAGAY